MRREKGKIEGIFGRRRGKTGRSKGVKWTMEGKTEKG